MYRYLLCAALLIPIDGMAALERLSLKTAMEKGMVKLTATTTGRAYNKSALHLKVRNTTKEGLKLNIDPALIFKPDDISYQPLVLPAEEILAIGPGGQAELDVQTFCGKLSASAPGGNLNYSFWKQGDSGLIKVTQYIRKNSLYNSLGQHAVWVMTDGRDLDGIIDPDKPKQSAELLALLKTLTNRPTPDYFKFYRLDTVAGQPVFRKRVLKIITNLEWKLEDASAVTLGIFNQQGDLVQGILDEKSLKRGGYKMQVQFEAEGAPAGKYFIRLEQNGKLTQERTVLVE